MGKQAPESLKVIFQYNHQHGTPHFPLLLDGQAAATSPIAIQVAYLTLCCFVRSHQDTHGISAYETVIQPAVPGTSEK